MKHFKQFNNLFNNDFCGFTRIIQPGSFTIVPCWQNNCSFDFFIIKWKTFVLRKKNYEFHLVWQDTELILSRRCVEINWIISVTKIAEWAPNNLFNMDSTKTICFDWKMHLRVSDWDLTNWSYKKKCFFIILSENKRTVIKIEEDQYDGLRQDFSIDMIL